MALMLISRNEPYVELSLFHDIEPLFLSRQDRQLRQDIVVLWQSVACILQLDANNLQQQNIPKNQYNLGKIYCHITYTIFYCFT
jgi:hypothetical protein